MENPSPPPEQNNQKLPVDDDEIKILQKQIDLIQIKIDTPDKKSWWKKNNSIAISIAALISALAFNGYNAVDKMRGENRNTESSKEEEIRANCLKMISLYQESLKLNIENANLSQMSAAINTERLILLNKTVNMVDTTKAEFAPDIYYQLGYELKNNSSLRMALKMFRLGLKAAIHDNVSKVTGYRYIGQLFAIKGEEIFNMDSVSKYRKLSISGAGNFKGEYKYDVKGYSYYLWAVDEIYNGNIKDGNSHIDSAESQYNKLSSYYGLKTASLNLIKQLKENSKNIPFNELFPLNGRWVIKSTEGQPVGVANFNNPATNTPNWTCNFEFFEDRKLAMMFIGNLVSVAKKELSFTFQGQKAVYFPDPFTPNKQQVQNVFIYGSVLLNLKDKSFKSINIELNLMGEKSRRYLLTEN